MSNPLMHTPVSLSDLSILDRGRLKALHAHGTCPDVNSLVGIADGLILPKAGVGRLRLWRGKVFHREADGIAGGHNRLGVGPFEFRRYRFIASQKRSSFSNRDVVFINHDLPGNPSWVRRFHDELVEITPGLYLATSHITVSGELRFMSHFALDLRANAK